MFPGEQSVTYRHMGSSGSDYDTTSWIDFLPISEDESRVPSSILNIRMAGCAVVGSALQHDSALG